MKLTAPAFAMAVTLALPAPLLADAPLRVVATVGMVGDIAARVGGTCAQVETLMGPGTDPHYYVATASDIRRLGAAELILTSGHGLEGRMGEVLARVGARIPGLAVAEAVAGAQDLLDDPDEPGTVDPHLWMDAALWSRTARVIADAIGERRPDCADALVENAARLEADLLALHRWIGEAIGSIPEDQRLLVTPHDAFNYFSRAYGIAASEAIEGISTESEASIADIREVADFVIENRLQAVFVETTINPRTIEALVAEVRARGHTVKIGGELFSDALGAAGTPEGSYAGMMRANTETMVVALGGTLPEWPAELSHWLEEWGVTE